MKLDGGEAVHCLREHRTSDILSEARQPSTTLLLVRGSRAGAAGFSDFTSQRVLSVLHTVTTPMDISLHMQMMIWYVTQTLLNKPTKGGIQDG